MPRKPPALRLYSSYRLRRRTGGADPPGHENLSESPGVSVPSLAVPAPDARVRPLLAVHFRERAWVYVTGVVAVVLVNLTEVLVPKCVQWGIDAASGVPGAARIGIAGVAAVLLVTLLFQAVGRRYFRLTLGRETHLAAATLKSALWERARLLPLARLDRDLTVGALMNTATGDVGTARAVFGWTVIMTTDMFFLTAFALVGMATIDAGLTGLVVLVSSATPLVVYPLSKAQYARHHDAQDALGRLNDRVAKSVSTVRLQKLMHTEALWARSLDDLAGSYRRKRFGVLENSLRLGLVSGAVPVAAQAVVFVVGIKKVLAGDVSTGGFVALLNYAVVLQAPVGEIGTLVSEWQRGLASLRRVTDVLREEPAPGLAGKDAASAGPGDGPEARVPAGNVPAYDVRDLTYSYPGSAAPVLSGVTVTVGAGEKVGIVGPIGSGKSTLLHILAGSEHGFSGRVDYFGRDVREVPHRTLRSDIVLVHQRPFLFADTVRQNLSLGRVGDDESLWRYLRAAGLEEEIRAFPAGLDTRLGEWGVNLSGGQKQRLTIARALAARPKVLLLDDCLSAVDTVTEQTILERLAPLLAGVTVVWTAHRRSTLRDCDRVVELA